MKILLMGLIAFFGWSGLSTYMYVCKIRGLCTEPTAKQNFKVNEKIIAGVNESNYILLEKSVFPNDLIIYFEFDKSELDTDIGTDKYIEKSNTYLNHNTTAMISITGYTDTVGTIEYNQDLGYRRAKTMQHYFESKGMPANKINIISKGENEPVEDNISDVGMATNRRTAITIKI